MGQYKAAKRSLEDALTTLSAMSGISCKEKEANAGILKNAIAKFSSREDTKEEKEGEATKDPRLVLEEGEDEKGVASCLTVQSTEGAGRHTIANQASAFQIEKLRPGPLLYHPTPLALG